MEIVRNLFETALVRKYNDDEWNSSLQIRKR